MGCISCPQAPDDRVTEAVLAPIIGHRRDFAAFGVKEPPAIVEVRQLFCLGMDREHGVAGKEVPEH